MATSKKRPSQSFALAERNLSREPTRAGNGLSSSPDDELVDYSRDGYTDGLSSSRTTSIGENNWAIESALPAARPRRGPFHSVLHRIWVFLYQPRPEDNEIVPHYRVLPILSGVVVPFSTLLEIPGLTEHWYIRTVDNKVVENRENPIILDVGLAISMACGLLANVFLVYRFLEKRPRAMTLLAIASLTVHDIINVVAVSTFGIIHRFNDGFTYGEAFWITVCSTIASTFVNVTLIIDFLQTKDFAKSGSGLTRKQRSLVIVIMILLCWIAFGALCNTFLLDENFISALYFTVVSVETIGFGDIVPHTIGARVFNTIYTVLGILNLALAVSIARETVIEAFEQSYRRRKHSLAERRRDYHRRRVTRQARTRAIEAQLRSAGLPVHIPKRRATITAQTELNINALTEAQLSIAMREAETATQRVLKPHSVVPPELDPSTSHSTIDQFRRELELGDQTWVAQEQSYKDYVQLSVKEETKETAAKLIVAWILFLLFWMLGALTFRKTEGWTFGEALYFCFVGFSTVGYGDISPQTSTGRAIFVVWALLGVAAMTILISVVSEAYSSKFHSIVAHDAVETAINVFRARINRRHLEKSPTQDREVVTSTGRLPPKGRISLQEVRTSMEHMSLDMIRMAKEFHDHLHYLNSATNNGAPTPESLRVLINDVEELGKMDDALKTNLLQNSEARKVLFTMAYEQRLRKFIDNAETTLLKLGEQSDDVEVLDDMLDRVLWRQRVKGDDEFIPAFDHRTAFLHANGLASEPDLRSHRSG